MTYWRSMPTRYRRSAWPPECRSQSSSATSCATFRPRASIIGILGRISASITRIRSGSPPTSRPPRRNRRIESAMFGYIVQRLLIMIPTVIAISIIVVSAATVVFTYVVAFPIGIYSATHQYSWSDHALTFVGFLGLATPNFLLALVLLYLANVYFGLSI